MMNVIIRLRDERFNVRFVVANNAAFSIFRDDENVRSPPIST